MRVEKGFDISALAPGEKHIEALKQQLHALMRAPDSHAREILADLDAQLKNFSLALMVNYHGFRILLPGDMNAEGYNFVRSDALKADLFKFGHHGQRDGADDELLKKSSHGLLCAAHQVIGDMEVRITV